MKLVRLSSVIGDIALCINFKLSKQWMEFHEIYTEYTHKATANATLYVI